jgi:hypothetical protein
VFISAVLFIINYMTDPLDNMETANGQLEDLNELRSLEAIFATKKTNAFGTTDIRLFKENLEAMGIVDLQNMAAKVGVNKYLSSTEIKAALIRSFERNAGTHQHALNIPKRAPTPQFDKNNPQHLALMKSLGMKTY